MAESTLVALEAYALMRETGCLVDQVSGAYCYVEAAHASSPADLYLYQLPLGLSLPNSTGSGGTGEASCSACGKSLMGLYAGNLEGGSGALEGLRETYGEAEGVVSGACGSGYATAVASGGGRMATAGLSWMWVGVGFVVGVVTGGVVIGGW